MVFFVCSSCGACLKKKQVEMHLMKKCRHTQIVSCMDCSKEFRGQEYIGHIQCITEDEKYGGSQYQAKEMKGMKKQEAWVANIKNHVASAHNMEPQLTQLLNHIVTFSNIPRKKAKFQNFLMNSGGRCKLDLVEKAWKVFELANVKQPVENNDKTQNENTANDNKANQSSDPAAEDPENQNPSLKRKVKKNKGDKSVENGVDNPQIKRKMDVEDNEEEAVENEGKKRKKRNHENEKQQVDTDKRKERKRNKKNKRDKGVENSVDNPEVKKKMGVDDDEGEVVENGGKKKKKRKHEDEKQLIDAKERKSKKKRKTEIQLDTPNENHDQEMTNGHDTLTNGDLAAVSMSFKWKTAIRTVLESGPEEGMKMTKLKKKVLALYLSSTKAASGPPKSEEYLSALLTKKLDIRNDKYIVHKDKVKLSK